MLLVSMPARSLEIFSREYDELRERLTQSCEFTYERASRWRERGGRCLLRWIAGGHDGRIAVYKLVCSAAELFKIRRFENC